MGRAEFCAHFFLYFLDTLLRPTVTTVGQGRNDISAYVRAPMKPGRFRALLRGGPRP